MSALSSLDAPISSSSSSHSLRKRSRAALTSTSTSTSTSSRPDSNPRRPAGKRATAASPYVPRFLPTPAAASASSSSNVPSTVLPASSHRPRVLLHDRCVSASQRAFRQSLVASNPHIAQAFFAADAVPEQSFPFTRCLSPSFPLLPYRERRRELKSVIPWGQRRLFLAELEFLSLHAAAQQHSPPQPSSPPSPHSLPALPSSASTGPPPPPSTVVYAGAAPGSHLSYLARLFPELTFVLYDTAPFRVQAGGNVQLKAELFDDSTACEWSGRSDVLLVSDIRSRDLFHHSVADVDAAIEADLAAQMRWVEAMLPARALLKFRLPWDGGSTPYLQGELRLPVWGSQTTTECRLIPSVPLTYTTYHHSTYEQQMFHFNTRHRVQIYGEKKETGEGEEEEGEGLPPTLTEQLQAAVTGERQRPRKRKRAFAVSSHRDRSASGLDHCYDCTAELLILKRFLLARPGQQQRLRKAIALQRGGGGRPGGGATDAASLTSTATSLHPPSALSTASSVITSISPASALSATVARQHAAIDDLATQLQRIGGEDREEESKDTGEEERKEQEKEGRSLVAMSDEVKGEEGRSDGEHCDCLDCLCVVLSDEVSSEMREGRTLLTAPLQPAGIGTANAKVVKKEKRARKKRRQQQRRARATPQTPRDPPLQHSQHFEVEHQHSD